MKEVKAIIRTVMLDRVVDALLEIEGLPGLTVSHVHGYGRAHQEPFDEGIGHSVKAKLEVMVPDVMVDLVVATIREAARTGRAGDGKIFVSGLERIVKVHDGEDGDDAL